MGITDFTHVKVDSLLTQTQTQTHTHTHTHTPVVGTIQFG